MEQEARGPKRSADEPVAKDLWIRVKGSPQPVEYNVAGLKNVSALLLEVYNRVEKRLEAGVTSDLLQLYVNQAAKEAGDQAIPTNLLMRELMMTGDFSWDDPGFVDYTPRDVASAQGIMPVTIPTTDAAYAYVQHMIEQGNFRLPALPQGCTELVARESPCEKLTDYIQKLHSGGNRGKDGKFPLIGCSGMPGIGKTALLVHGVNVLIPRITGGCPIPAAAIYVTFNGNGTSHVDFLSSVTRHGSEELLADAFGHMILVSCGVPFDTAVHVGFTNFVNLCRSATKLEDHGLLCFFVDELSHLRDRAEGLMSQLMGEVDKRNGKLAAIFAHIRQDVLDEQETRSGRPVIGLPLPPLPIECWRDLLPGAVAAASRSPALHQLLLSCCGHPRALFDGMEAARRAVPNLFSNPTKQAIILAQEQIIATCKFKSLIGGFMEDTVPKWFNFIEPMSTQNLARDGVLLTIPGDVSNDVPKVELLHPLLLRGWAQDRCNISPIAFHLQQAYAADCVVGHDAEKSMEAVMYHYEAVLRKAVQGKKFHLTQLYQSNHVGHRFMKKMVQADVPPGNDIVAFVESFEDMTQVLELLNEGFIVVSKAHSEVGIEYYSPYRDLATQKLIIAATQCKFVQGGLSWKTMKDKMQIAMQRIKKKDMHVVPVYYTTVDQASIKQASYEDGVYFVEADLFAFTKKLGVLRLHCEKLGARLQTMHPWLQRAGSADDIGP